MAFALAEPMSPEEREERLGEFSRYITELITARRAQPGDGLIDDLIAARDGEDRLTEAELPNLVMVLIVGGTETTLNTLGRSMLTLLRDGGALWSQLVESPSLIPAAVEELLRYNAIGDLLELRVATEDVELPSGKVEEGDAVVIAVRAALGDPDVYEDPDTVRFDRKIAAPLYFGGGPHFCIGSHLAKAELEIALAVLVERLPTLRLSGGPPARGIDRYWRNCSTRPNATGLAGSCALRIGSSSWSAARSSGSCSRASSRFSRARCRSIERARRAAARTARSASPVRSSGSRLRRGPLRSPRTGSGRSRSSRRRRRTDLPVWSHRGVRARCTATPPRRIRCGA